VAQARLGVLDGAAANLQKALKLEPTNREAKRELARLQERLKKRRSGVQCQRRLWSSTRVEEMQCTHAQFIDAPAPRRASRRRDVTQRNTRSSPHVEEMQRTHNENTHNPTRRREEAHVRRPQGLQPL